MRTCAVAVSLLVLGVAVAAAETTPRVVGPQTEWAGASLDRFDPSWVHVKFVEGSGVRIDPAAAAGAVLFVDDGGLDLDAVNRALVGAQEVRRTFAGDRAQFREWKRLGEAASGETGPDLSLWFDVRLEPDRDALARALNTLNAIDAVEIAHPAPICEPAAIMGGAVGAALGAGVTALMPTPDFTPQQDYLFDPPVGLDAPSAWAVPGGRGAGMKFIDVELGWVFSHEDFDQANFFHSNGNDDPSYRDHGTAVVGEVVGADNGYGITGFASDAQWGTVGIRIGDWPVVPQWFQQAVDALDAGDVWLIELQMYPSGRDATPMEYLQVNYDVIWTGSWARGIVCIEAGANGSQDLDDAFWNGLFDRNVRDSGAIMVGAGTPTGRVAEWFTNYGSRMDAHAWGSSIVTTGYGDLYSGGGTDTEYTRQFGGTSGASPMVTGSALCLQGIARERYGAPLTPLEIRTLINTTGIPHLGTQLIGPRPDLGAAVDELLSSCIADFNADGTVNSRDFVDYLNAFVAGDPSADVNADGTVDSRDFTMFLNEFRAGC
jgi:serine protease